LSAEIKNLLTTRIKNYVLIRRQILLKEVTENLRKPLTEENLNAVFRTEKV